MKSFLKNTAAMLVLAAITASSVFAQGQRQRMSPEQMQQRFEEQTKEMITALELTEEQIPLFTEIMVAANADRMDLMEDMSAGTVERSAMRGKMEEMEKNTREALAGVLTETQMEKYGKILEERQGQRRRRGPAGT